MALEEKIQRSELIKNWLEVVAIIIAAPWALYTFYFQYVLLPQKELPYLVISSQHYIAGQKGEYYIVRSQVKIKNFSKMRTRVVGADFNLVAIEADTNDFYDSKYPRYVKANIDTFTSYSRFAEGKSLTVNVGKLIPTNWKLDPQEEFNKSFVSLVPIKGYDIIRFSAEVYACRESDDSLNVEWRIDSLTGSISLLPRKNRRLLDSTIDKNIIIKSGLQQFQNIEEFACSRAEKNRNEKSLKNE